MVPEDGGWAAEHAVQAAAGNASARTSTSPSSPHGLPPPSFLPFKILLILHCPGEVSTPFTFYLSQLLGFLVSPKMCACSSSTHCCHQMMPHIL